MKHLHFVFLIGLVLSVGAPTTVLAAEPVVSGKSGIEYSTLEEALNALRAKPGVTFKDQDGWLVANDSDAIVIWLFTPQVTPRIHP
jgi:hypothetical protein